MSTDRFEDIERKVFRTLARLGWGIPLSEEEVAKAEGELEKSPVDIPIGLEDPSRLLKKIDSNQLVTKSLGHTDPGTVDNLARAAREGGEIPPDVEERMKHDRDLAESKNRDGA